jgi:hypothetical protein
VTQQLKTWKSINQSKLYLLSIFCNLMWNLLSVKGLIIRSGLIYGNVPVYGVKTEETHDNPQSDLD